MTQATWTQVFAVWPDHRDIPCPGRPNSAGAGLAREGGVGGRALVRRDLWARVTRALFFDLVEIGEERAIGGTAMFGVASDGEFFAMAPAASLQDLTQ